MDRARTIFLYFTVFVTGAAVLVIEILGTRLLAPFYGSTIFVWSALISVTLGFLALGYMLGGWLADRIPKPLPFYALVALAGIATFAFSRLKPVIIPFADGFGLKFAPLAAAALLFGVPLLLFGMMSPYVIRLTTRRAERVGERAGAVFALATVGSLVGAISAGFFLIPTFPVSAILTGLTVVLVAVAILGALLTFGVKTLRGFTSESSESSGGGGIQARGGTVPPQQGKEQQRGGTVPPQQETYRGETSESGEENPPPSPKARQAGKGSEEMKMLGILLLVGVALAGVGVKDRTLAELPDDIPIFKQEVLFEATNFYGENRLVGIPRALDGKFCFLIDGTVQGCVDPNDPEADDHVPVAAAADILPVGGRFLMLGLGMGEFFYNFGTGRLQVDVVDINPAAFAATDLLLGDREDVRYMPYLADARAYLRDTDVRYHLIFSDLLSNAVFPDYVFSREALELTYARLTDNGMYVFSFIGRTDGTDPVADALFATTQSVFPYVYVSSERPENWFSYNLVLAAKAEPDLNAINDRIVRLLGEEDAAFRPAEPSAGLVVSDDYNRLLGLWTNNLIAETDGVNDFRNKFKRLSRSDFLK